MCGTAAVISPVARIHSHEGDIEFPASQDGCGPVLKKLRAELAGIQACDIEGPEGWVCVVC